MLAANGAKAQLLPTVTPSNIPFLYMPIGSYQTQEFSVTGGTIQTVISSSSSPSTLSVQELSGGGLLKRIIKFIASRLGDVKITLSFSIEVTGTNNTTVVDVKGDISVTTGSSSSYMASQYLTPPLLIAIEQKPMNFQFVN